MQTYFSLLATLLTVFACAIVILIAVFVFEDSLQVLFLLIPAALIVFLISLIIGHFLAEPLRILCRNTHAFTHGGPHVSFSLKGELYEADRLAESFEELANVAETKHADLALREKRQTAFISDVAHELRTPLTAIHGNAEMLLDPELPPELHAKFCQIIISESERLGRLTNDLLTLQHIEEAAVLSALQRINLHNLAREVLDIMTPLLTSREAKIELSGEAPDVLGHPDRLKQVISNLIENATRFIEPGGKITVELFGIKNNSIIAVKDNGQGFGDADPKLLFDRFYRTDASRSRETGGSGLGLAIVKSIVEAHDGSVEAFNLPEGGACFLVAIPSIFNT